ncbi:unnamed protein product [Debaryomyces tyrocola]|nr:unnamed protein product [Debaryomyces tyrocola]
MLNCKLVKDVLLTDEDTYKINFLNYLFNPVCEYVASLLHSEIEVRNKNTVCQTGVHTKIPHTTNDLFQSDIFAYAEKKHYRSLAVVEVKKLPLLRDGKVINLNEPKMVRLFVLDADMFSNHTN